MMQPSTPSTRGAARLASRLLQPLLVACIVWRMADAASTDIPSPASTYSNAAAPMPIPEPLRQQLLQRLNAYEFGMPADALRRGLVYMGEPERLRRIAHKLASGQAVSLGSIGGSITAGQGAVDGKSWVTRLHEWTNQTFPNVTHNLVNGAIAGSRSDYMASCVRWHVPLDADIVFVEYAVNDDGAKAVEWKYNEGRKSFERLLRKLLELPNRPAVVLFQAYAWHLGNGTFWSNAEEAYSTLALYYGLPWLSVKGCCYHLMREGRHGFKVHLFKREHESEVGRDEVFYYDEVHPDGHAGHKFMAEQAISLVREAVRDVLDRPLTPADASAAEQPIPPPMVPGNFASKTDTCLMAQQLGLDEFAVSHEGWRFLDEGKRNPGGQYMPKWGWVSDVKNATLRLRVSSMASAGAADVPVTVELGYLKSHQHMGTAEVSCVAGCSCNATMLEGHWEEHKSLTHLHPFPVSQHPNCTIAVRVLPGTQSGEHKVKISAVIVYEEAGHAGGMASSDTFSWVESNNIRSAEAVAAAEAREAAADSLMPGAEAPLSPQQATKTTITAKITATATAATSTVPQSPPPATATAASDSQPTASAPPLATATTPPQPSTAPPGATAVDGGMGGGDAGGAKEVGTDITCDDTVPHHHWLYEMHHDACAGRKARAGHLGKGVHEGASADELSM